MMTTTTTTSPLDLAALSLHQIDRELAVLQDTLDRTSNPDIAVQFAQRREELQMARTVVLARERAQKRQAETARAEAAHAAFAKLEAELRVELRASAAAIDAWIANGGELLKAYRGSVARLNEVAALAAGPANGGHELELVDQCDKLTSIEPLLEQQLGLVGVFPHVVVPRHVRNPTFKFEAYADVRLHKFLAVVKRRLPPVPGPGVVEEPGI